VIGIHRFILVIALVWGFAVFAAAGDSGGLFHRKTRLDSARVRQLVDTVRADQDENRRKTAIRELSDADPRVQVEVIPILVSALRKDSSEAVRIAAADVIGRYSVVFPVAGLALEDAAIADRSIAVRAAARQSLWEYHLLGYRSAKGGDAFAAQTAEPPIAKPTPPIGALTSEPLIAPYATTVSGIGTPTISPLPPVGPPPGPRDVVGQRKPGELVTAIQPHPNLTVEPPIARRSTAASPTPMATTEPPIRPRFVEPLKYGPPPRLASNLPSIVPPPGPIPGVTPFPEPTSEPPRAKANGGR
jgi:hypothetical protein